MTISTAFVRYSTVGIASFAMLVLAGCTGSTAAVDEEARDAITHLRSSVARLEETSRRRTKQLDDMARRIEISDAQIAAMKKQLEEARAPAEPEPEPPAVVKEDPTDSSQPAQSRIAFDEFTLKVQKALKRAGYDPGPEDGKKGPNTTRALQAFQKENNIPTSGMADEATWALLKRYLE